MYVFVDESSYEVNLIMSVLSSKKNYKGKKERALISSGKEENVKKISQQRITNNNHIYTKCPHHLLGLWGGGGATKIFLRQDNGIGNNS
jgi:hypothetical protein